MSFAYRMVSVEAGAGFFEAVMSHLGHGQTAKDVRTDGSFPRKQPLRPFCTMRV
jgi:hypothetical protein